MDITAKENDDMYENDEKAIAELLSEFQSDDAKTDVILYARKNAGICR